MAVRGSWTAESDLTFSYQWTRGGNPIGNAICKRYRPRLRDIGRQLRVEVTATDEAGESTSAISAPVTVRRATFRLLERPSLKGTQRYTRVLEADRGRWSVKPESVTYRWFRDGTRIRGAKNRRYQLRADDVGHHVKVRVTVRKEGYRRDRAHSRRTRAIKHRVSLRRTATYRIETRGNVTASMKVFRRQVAQGHEINERYRAGGGLKLGLQDQRARAVTPLDRRDLPRGRDLPAAVLGCSQQRSKARRRVETGEAKPVDRAIPTHQRAGLAVPDQGIVLDAERHQAAL